MNDMSMAKTLSSPLRQQRSAQRGNISRAATRTSLATCQSTTQSHAIALWNSPVYSSFDDDGNFYWVSSPEGQHSKNVEANGQAFFVIYDSTVPEGTGEGVYVEASVEVLNDLDDIAKARRNLSLRVGKPLDDHPERFLDGDVRRAYRATPKRVWMNDDEKDEYGEYVRDVRVEIPVDSLRNLTT